MAPANLSARPVVGRWSWWLAALLALATVALYWPSLKNGFVNYDDDRYVTANLQIQSGVTLENIHWALVHPVADNWHPLTVWSHMLICQICGLNPAGHHLANVILHAVNAGLVFLLFRRLTGALWRSFFVATLFAFHPLRVESVAWIAERKDVLSGFFGLLALWSYASYAAGSAFRSSTGSSRPWYSRPKTSYGLSLLWLTLGLMSKPMLVTWPFVMLLLDYWPLQRIPSQSKVDALQSPHTCSMASLFPLLAEKIPFFVLSFMVCAVTFLVQKHGEAVETIQNRPLADRIGNALISYCRYLEKTFWPVDLAVLYPHPGAWPVTQVAAAAVFLAGLSLAVILFRRRHAYWLTGWFWFLGTLVPVIGLVQVGLQAMADRYTYLPSLGVLILVVWGAWELLRAVPNGSTIMALAALITVVMSGILTRHQLAYWHDSESLFRHAIAVTGPNAVAQYNLGVALDKQDCRSQAIDEYRKVIRLQPENTSALLNLGKDLDSQGDTDEAMAEYREVIRLEPANAKAHNNLGIALFKQGRTPEATAELQAAVQLAPNDAQVHNSLAAALYTAGQEDGAVEEFEAAVKLDPDYAEAHFNLGCVLAHRGQKVQAVSQFQTALRLKPSYREATEQLNKLRQ